MHIDRNIATTRDNSDPYANLLGFETISWEENRAVLAIEVKNYHKNDYGAIHGGALLSLADHTTGTVVHSDGRSYVTQNLSMNFISNINSGKAICEADVIKRGRTISVVSYKIKDANGKLIATGESTFFCVSV